MANTPAANKCVFTGHSEAQLQSMSRWFNYVERKDTTDVR